MCPEDWAYVRIFLVEAVAGISVMFRLEFDFEHVEGVESVPYVPYASDTRRSSTL